MNTVWSFVANGLISFMVAYATYRAAVRKHERTTKDSDKSIYVMAVTNERAKWRDELRKAVARFCSQAIEVRPNIANLQELRTEILLRLNPHAFDPPLGEHHKFDRAITLEVDAIFHEVLSSSTGAIYARIGALQSSAQGLLKQEWEVSKSEARLGERNCDLTFHAFGRTETLRRVFAESTRSASTQIPLPIVLGVVGLLAHLLSPSLIGGWTAFSIGFVSGVVLLFFAGYYETRVAALAGDASENSGALLVPDPELQPVKIIGVRSIVLAEKPSEIRPTDRERSP
jgi:hypothetical protein